MTDKTTKSESVAPTDDTSVVCDPRQEAGQDETIVERLTRDPASPQAKLDRALDESMDASDPPSPTAPDGGSEPARSSGFDPKAEAALRRK